MNVQEATNLTITEGEVKAIHDSSNRQLWGRLNYDTTYKGDTTQSEGASPSTPQTVNVVTGTQTITLTDGEVSDDYTVTLGSTELVKVGTYQDYIYKSGNNWYIHKETGKVTLNGSETWSAGWNKTYSIIKADYMANLYIPSASINLFVNSFVPTSSQSNILLGNVYAGGNFLNFNYDDVGNDAGLPAFQTWLSSHNIIIYAPLTSATDTQITDTSLISELNAIHDWLTRYGYTATVAGNLPLIISQTALT